MLNRIEALFFIKILSKLNIAKKTFKHVSEL
jgi:hypothetical protein